MISVRNHLLQLSGNKWLLFVAIAMAAVGCSPKVRPVVSTPARAAERPAEKKRDAEKIALSPSQAKAPAISMLLPFSLDNLTSGYTPGTLNRANLSLDFYQGFKLALDSLAGQGYNYKLQIFDTKDQAAQAQNLAYNPFIRTSNLIVGPVFPEDLQAFTSTLAGMGRPIPTVSPLSPASPATIKDQYLVTVATPLEYHAWSAAEFITEHYKSKKIFILKSGFSEENNFVTPFKKGIDSLSKHKIKIIAPVIVRGQLGALIPQLSSSEQNIFVIPATNQAFLMVTLHALDSLAQKYPVTLFGHPSWAKFSYLKPDILQRLKTHITASDRIDYKLPGIVAFTRLYRKIYHNEPTMYSLMGFDEGLYFGGLLAKDPEELKTLDKYDYSGLLNKYRFVKRAGQGWVNSHANMLQYTNFELKKTE